MCGLKKEEDRGDCSETIHTMNDMQQQQVVFQQEHQQQLILQQLQMMQQQQQQQNSDLLYGGGGGGEGLIFPPPPPPPQHQEVSPIFPWSLPPPVHAFNPSDFDSGRDGHDPFTLLPPPPAPYGRGAAGLFQYSRDPNSLQFAYEGGQPSSAAAADHHLRLISEALGGPAIHPGSSSSPFLGLHAELGKMTAQEIMDAKALAASKSHSEAERRRRERINNHLAKLRSLLPSTSKTDKASLLAEVIQHVKELKRQTSVIAESSLVPTETDELTVDMADDEDGKLVIKASLCCEDRSDLLPDLIKTLKALRLRTLKAEITTLGGRVRNVLFITAEGGGGEEDDDEDEDEATADQQHHQCSISSIHDALKAVMEKTATDDQSTTSGSSVKRQRTNINILS